jgi:DNA invertase Pin-like site-specific DNA recombinase
MINIIYCRVSNLKIESQSFSTQESNCTEYCKKNKLRIKAIHKEHNSGYGRQKNLETLIKSHKNINLIVNDITRFSRSHQYGNKLLDVCLKKNIILHFVKENIILDPETNYHLVQAGLENSEHQWTTIRNNIIANIKYRKALGLCLGNAPFGFDTIDKKLVKNENFDVVRLIIALRNSVKKCSEIRKILQILSTESDSLKFYENYYENYIEKEKEIEQFTNAFTLDFKTIAKILNDYKVSNKHWIPSRVEEIYKRNCLDIEFKNETEYAIKYSTDVGAIRRYMSDLSLLNDAMQED